MMRYGLIVGILFLTGCGRSGEARVPVKGRVLLDGQPIAKLALHLIPEGTTSGSGSLGVTNADGEFSMVDVRGPEGAFVGSYQLKLNENGLVKLPKAVPTIPVAVAADGSRLEIRIEKSGKATVQVSALK